jgi:hypothetical protein
MKTKGKSFWSLCPYWIAPAILSLVLALYFQDPFSGEWDSLDYTVYAVKSWFPSTLLLGRILFIYVNRIAYLASSTFLGLQAQDAYLLFKYMVIFQTPLAIISMWVLARELTNSARSATLAALILTLSPFFISMSGQVMTEIPSVLIFCVAITIHIRGLRARRIPLIMAGAALLGFGVNVREGVGLFGVWLALAPFVYGWKFDSRSLQLILATGLIFIICALGPFAVWFLSDLDRYRFHWLRCWAGSASEAQRHPISFDNLAMLFRWFFLTSPLAFWLIPFATWWQWSTARMTPVLLLGILGTTANLSLILHYSMVLHGRYSLTGLPAIAPLVALYIIHLFDRIGKKIPGVHTKKRLGFATGGVLLIGAGILNTFLFLIPSRPSNLICHQNWFTYKKRLDKIPSENSVIMASVMTVAVNYWSGMGAGNWKVIGCGSGWPGNDKIVSVIQNYMLNDQRIFIDTDPKLWRYEGWQSEETEAAKQLDKNFRFRHLSDTIYEICPITDSSANDNPDLAMRLKK